MPGDEKVRFCAECGKNVYELTLHTEAEGRALFDARKGERTCVRFAKDSSGAVRFKAAAFAAAVAVAGCATHPAEHAAVPPSCAMDTGDRDMGDTIPDGADKCPDVPAGPNDVDDDGCPEAVDAGASADDGSSPAPSGEAKEP